MIRLMDKISKYKYLLNSLFSVGTVGILDHFLKVELVSQRCLHFLVIILCCGSSFTTSSGFGAQLDPHVAAMPGYLQVHKITATR